MAELIADDKPLPLFRKDLEVYEGPAESDGSPTYNIYDPVRAKYFKINWAESLVVNNLKPGMTLDDMHKFIEEKTTLKVTKEEIKFFFIDAFRQDLLAVMKSSKFYENQHEAKVLNPFMWLLMNYLYIRIPLFNPDPFLSRTIKYVRFLGSNTALFMFAMLSLFGVVLLLSRFGEFISTFTYFFNAKGILIYALAITSIKIVHEFSHAYTAKSYNVYVPSMGVALIVLWPVLYTDVTDGWKLKKRKERLFISGAGIIAEMIIAGLATTGWYFSSPGLLQSVFFVVASLTWISTLMINLNPAIRFDGYYILSDLWGIDNLQWRSFNVARWKLRELFLGIQGPPPEDHLTHHRMTLMVSYAIFTWIYRVFIYTAIAVFVYYKFTKALGAFLFFLEISVFLVWPIASEIKAIATLKERISINPRLLITVSVLLLLFGWFAFPLPHMERYPAITVPVSYQSIYIPSDSFIEKIFVERDQNVEKGENLIKLRSLEFDSEIEKLKIDEKILEKQIYLLGLTDTDRAYIPEKVAELESKKERLKALEDKRKELEISADISGKMYFWDDNLYPGLTLSKDRIIGKLANIHDVDVIAFVPETEIRNIKEGQSAWFRVHSTTTLYKGVIVSVNPLRSTTLKYPSLGSVFHGELAVTEDRRTGSFRMVSSYYTLKIRLDNVDEPPSFGKIGEAEIEGPWRSKLGHLLSYLLQIFWRESAV